MRVGLVSAEYPPAIGGVGDHTARLARELAREGHAVEVLTSRTAREVADESKALRRVWRWDHRIWWQMPRIARELGWEVLHIQYQPAAYALHGAINVLPWVVRALRGPAVVTTFHDLRVPYLFPKAGRLRRAAVAALAKGSDAVICVADSDLEQLRVWRASRPPDTTRHVPLGDQLDEQPPPEFSRAGWRRRIGVPAAVPLVGHFGLINQSKGVLQLVGAVAKLPDAHLVLVGEALGASDPTNAAYLAGVRSEVERLGLGSRVHWTGYVSPTELAGWLATVDVVALPFLDGATLRRTSLVTAWRRGVPVVTTEPLDFTEWRADGVGRDAARYVPPGYVQTLVGALGDVLASPALRESLSAAGRAFGERFSWDAVVAQTTEVYEAAIRAHRA
jgi:glycosyltransferase involved in cell wall biosynthesis